VQASLTDEEGRLAWWLGGGWGVDKQGVGEGRGMGTSGPGHEGLGATVLPALLAPDGDHPVLRVAAGPSLLPPSCEAHPGLLLGWGDPKLGVKNAGPPTL